MLYDFKKVFHAGKHDFYIQAKVTYNFVVVQTIFTYWNNIVVILLNMLTTSIILTQWKVCALHCHIFVKNKNIQVGGQK